MNGFSERPYSRNTVMEVFNYTAIAAAENIDAYTVPTDYHFFLRILSAMNGSRGGGNMIFQVKRGATLYRFGSTVAYAIVIPYAVQPMIHLITGDIISVRLTGMVAGDAITVTYFGELLPVGGWG